MNTRVVDLCSQAHLPFERINMTSRTLCAAFTLIGILAVAQPASAATILLNADGKLIGATGVSVEGSLYDVAFVDGSCVNLFSGCDSSADFTFTTLSGGLAASQALLDQVFLGSFDTTPTLTFGCGYPSYCQVLTPYGSVINLNGELVALVGNAVNSDDSYDGAFQSATSGTYDVSGAFPSSLYVYADFTLAATPVPEPASMLLLGTGLAGAGLRRWRQKRA